ncbi:TetR/AcrR family transcriptional regulator [Neisseria sp.]|uniref:TetR/AcrR family transcriptional regulator n=1 Tax=Neisseria sp. TaxID=192066 RepID=UPI0035A13FC0
MDTRQKIIETAYQTFYRQGFHACGVELLAQQAGVTKRTLYAHFGSKDGLIAAVMDYRHHDFINKMQAALSRRPEEKTAEAYLDFIAAWTQENGFCGCLFLNACAEFSATDSEPNRTAAAHKREIRRILYERMQHAGTADAAAQADRTFLLGEGMIAAAQAGQRDLTSVFQSS